MSEHLRETSENALADQYYANRHEDGEWGEPEPLEKPARLGAVRALAPYPPGQPRQAS